MKILILVAFFFALSFAGKQYGVYDTQGKRISTFEAELYELPEKTQQIKSSYPNKNIYISFLNKGKGSKPIYRYRYKAETGAYIEASRKETFSVCPDKEIQGTWISEYSVSLNAENCISVQTPNLAGTFRILFMQSSGRTDTVQVLVDQSYIEMGNYSHKAWVQMPIDSMPWHCRNGNRCKLSDYGHYENKRYDQALIVDKTEFTMGDAWHYYSEFGISINKWFIDASLPEGMAIYPPGGPVMPQFTQAYPSNEDFKISARPYLGDHYYARRVANMRSKLEGLDTIYGAPTDTGASGYRVPYKEEWGMLMRAGASTRYYWGEEEDSLTVSRYTLVRPIGYMQHKVAQKQPNAFGLYDMISPNNTVCEDGHLNRLESEFLCAQTQFANQMRECSFLAGEIARKVEDNNSIMVLIDAKTGKEIKSAYTSYFGNTSVRFMRKTPKLNRLEKF